MPRVLPLRHSRQDPSGDVTVPVPHAPDTRAGVQPCAKWHLSHAAGPSPAPSLALCPLGHTLRHCSTPHLPLHAAPC